MITVIGKPLCGKCEDIQRKFKEKGIEFEYKSTHSMDGEQIFELMKKSSEAGNMMFPILFKDDEPTTYKEVISNEVKN